MDPTWSNIKEVKKYYSYDSKGNRKTIGKCKVVSRIYYDAIPEFNSLTHKPNHPAFYLLEEVASYKSSFKEQYKQPNKRNIVMKNYDFNVALDGIYDNQYPEMSSKLGRESNLYSNKNSSYSFFKK